MGLGSAQPARGARPEPSRTWFQPEGTAPAGPTAVQCDRHTRSLRPIIRRYGQAPPGDEPERLRADGLNDTRSGGLGLLRDLQDLYLLGCFVDITWTMIKQAAQGLRDTELLEVVRNCDAETAVQVQWIRTRMKQATPQALVAST